MMRRFFILLLLFPFCSCAQSARLFFSQEDNPGQRKFVEDNNIKTYDIVYQQFFTTADTLDQQRLINRIRSRYPDKNASGYLVLDWEGKAMEYLTKQDDQEMFDFYIDQYVKAIRLVKQERPRLKVGYYALPYRQYWGIDETFEQKNYRLLPILREQDFIAPSLYVFYPYERSKASNKRYIDKNVSLSLKIADELGIPVYPFINHRIHPSNREHAGDRISNELFRETIYDIMAVDYHGTRSSGIFWWHVEYFSYRNRANSKQRTREYENVKDPDEYQRKMFQSYYDSIKDIVK